METPLSKYLIGRRSKNTHREIRDPRGDNDKGETDEDDADDRIEGSMMRG